MQEYIGCTIKFTLLNGTEIGKLIQIDTSTNTFTILTGTNQQKQILTSDISNLELMDICISQILKDAFNIYGPSEEYISCCATKGIVKILEQAIRITKSDPILIYVQGSSFFSRIGYYLASELQLFYSNVVLYIADEQLDSRNVILKHKFTINKYPLIESFTGNYKAVVVCKEQNEVCDINFDTQNLIYTDFNENIDGKNCFLVTYTVVPNSFYEYKGKVYCVDVGLTNENLSKYGQERKCETSVFRVKN